MQTRADDFLGGRVQARQPVKGFRSGADAVLLAAAVPAEPGQAVLELGVGAGVASLCLAARVPGLVQAGLEVQPDYADLARQNGAAAGSGMEVFEGDVADMPAALRARSFDHVMMNPPYYRSGGWSPSGDEARTRALGESEGLGAWLDAATRRLAPGGWLTIILKAPRMADAIRAADDRLGSLQVKPLAPRAGRPAELVVLRCRKGGRADPILFPPLVLHEGDFHTRDAAHPTAEAEAVLRHGGILEF